MQTEGSVSALFCIPQQYRGGPKLSAKELEKQYTVYCTMDRSTETI